MAEEAPDHRDGYPHIDPEGWWTRLWSPFWAVPMAIITTSLLVGIALPVADSAIVEHVPYVFEGGPAGARSVLSTIATAMISVTGLVFSITMVVLQLASSQFSPRVLGGFLSSRITQTTLGVFTASFVYSLTVLRSVRGGDDTAPPFVPQVSVTLAYLLVLASVGCFIAFIHHITTSIQVSRVVADIGERTLTQVPLVMPAPGPQQTRPVPQRAWSGVLPAEDFGYVTHVDHEALRDAAVAHDLTVEVLLAVGEVVVEGRPLLRVAADGPISEELASTLREGVIVGPDRTMRQEVGYGVRQLVDIAERALSPGINDPTTAVRVVDELHRVLRLAVTRGEPGTQVRDEAGVVRVVHRPQRLPDLLDQVAELAWYARESPPVPARLGSMVADLLDVAEPEHRPALHRLAAQVRDPGPAPTR